MTYKIFAILPLLVTVAMIPFAFADHPLTHGYQEHECFSFYTPSDNKYTTNCSWSYTPNERELEIIQAIQPIDEPEIVEKVEVEIIEAPKRLDTSDPKQAMEYYIDRLEKDAEHRELSTAEEELLKMLESVQEICYLGIEEGKPIQKFAQFIIPTYEPNVETDLGNKWLLNQLFKKQQECSGWNIYKEQWLGQQYLDIQTENINRAEIIKAELLKKYPSDFTDPVTQRDLDNEAEDSKKTICRSTLWGNDFKKDSGCMVVEATTGGTLDFSKAGQNIMNKWQLYQNTGELDMPKKQFVDREPTDKESLTVQYLQSLGWTTEQINAALKAMEDEN